MSTNARVLSKVRNLLSKRWIDTQRLRIHLARDAVRITGELVRLGMTSAGAGESLRLDVLEAEVKRIDGVRRVYFELTNWVRDDSGKWVSVDKGSDHRHVAKRFVIRGKSKG